MSDIVDELMGKCSWCEPCGMCKTMEQNAANEILRLRKELDEAKRDQEAMLGLQATTQTHNGWFVRITNQRKVWWNSRSGRWAFLLTPRKSDESDIISEHDTMAEAIIAARTWNLEAKP